MSRKRSPQPTPAELQVLQALWKVQPATVRNVHEHMTANRPCAYTTTLKFLQIMLEKGLVTREESQRSHVYKATVTEEEVQRDLTTDLVQRAFGGSVAGLVMQALCGKKAGSKELAKIRRFLDEMERRKK